MSIAINEPDAPDPLGPDPRPLGTLYCDYRQPCFGRGWAGLLGPIVFVAALIGLAFAWPIRRRRSGSRPNGMVGPLVCGLTY